MTPDVNVLVAAFRADHPHHRPAYAALSEALAACAAGGVLRLMPMATASFLRLVTHPKIFVEPAPVEAATDFLDALLAVPGVEMPALGGEWPIFRQLCAEHRLAANAIPDAWLAAAVIHFGEHLLTFDADFRRLLQRSQLSVLKAG
jgi:hypothetical protein